MGPAPGSNALRGEGVQKHQTPQTKKTEPPDILAAIKEQPPAPKYAPDCQADKDGGKDNCFLQWRAAAAAEAQARYTYDQAWYAWVGAILIFVTLLLTAAATWAATISASAATRALTDLERPHVFVEVKTAGLSINLGMGGYSMAGGRFDYECVNHGRTPAALAEILPRIVVLPAGNFPTPVDPTVDRGSTCADWRELPTGTVATERKAYPEGDTAMKTYPPSLLGAGAARSFRIYFIGYVRYADMIVGKRYVNGFCFLYDHVGDRFVRRGDNQRYNYTRKE